MGVKYAFLLLALQAALCLGQNQNTEIKLLADLQTGQSIAPAVYVATADLIDGKHTKVPGTIKVATTTGVWVLDKAVANVNGGLITLTSAHAFNSITLRLFTTAEAKVTYGAQVVTVPITTGWVNHKFDFSKLAANTEPVINLLF